MFNFLKKKSSVIPAEAGIHKSNISSSRAQSRDLTPPTESLTLHLSGLHCTSCAVNIDLALEDLPGVKAKTNYAKSETKIEYDPDQTTLDEIHFVIRDLGYSIM